jgi:bifunctional DNA-binding transcriptional regulator/antitoxin component of YhaV-PrlF toxin-antitoxin module
VPHVFLKAMAQIQGTLMVMQFCLTTLVRRAKSTMATLTVTTKGQVTFRKDVLQHLGIRPGERIEVDLLPNGRGALSAMHQKASLRTLHGFLKGKTNSKLLTLEEIDNAIAEAGASAGRASEIIADTNVLLRAVVGDVLSSGQLAANFHNAGPSVVSVQAANVTAAVKPWFLGNLRHRSGAKRSPNRKKSHLCLTQQCIMKVESGVRSVVPAKSGPDLELPEAMGARGAASIQNFVRVRP